MTEGGSNGQLAAHAIEHADRMWRAESENALRYSVRTNLLMTLVLALGGGGLTVLPRLVTPTTLTMVKNLSTWGRVTFLGFVVATLTSLAFLLMSLHALVEESVVTEDDLREQRQAREARDAQRRSVTSLQGIPPSTASKHMELPSETIESLPEEMGEAPYLIFVRTYEAAIDLGARNDSRKRQLRRSSKRALAALIAGALATFFYMMSLAFLSDATQDSAGKEAAREQAVNSHRGKAGP